MEDIYGMNLRCTFAKVNNVTTVNAYQYSVIL